MSQTKEHYQPYICFPYSGSLPSLINKPTERHGFHQLRIHSKKAPLGEKVQQTEYQRLFVPHCLTPSVSVNHVTVGPKRQTGFTEGTERQFFTFEDKNSCTVELHQTPSSVMKSDFVPPSFLKGAVEVPSLCRRSHRESGFTRGTLSPLAYPSSLLPSTQTKISVPAVQKIGKKEPTGFIRNAPNNHVFPKAPLNSSHFLTHYETQFCQRDNFKKRASCTQSPGLYIQKDADRFILRR